MSGYNTYNMQCFSLSPFSLYIVHHHNYPARKKEHLYFMRRHSTLQKCSGLDKVIQ